MSEELNRDVKDVIALFDGDIEGVATFAVRTVGILDQFRNDSRKVEQELRAENARLREALRRIANSLKDYDDDLPAFGIAVNTLNDTNA